MKVSKEFIQGAARLAHAANRAYCESLADYSVKPWDQLADDEKDRIVDGVWYVIENSAAGPDALHANWLNYMIADGWSYSEIKSRGMKTHPCMVTFDELPLEQQSKYHIFRAIVLELARVAGYKTITEVVRDVASNQQESADV